jgi:spore coat polysaccharide biosynthesis protein SpsF
MSIQATIQVRLNSTRLPGKVLKPILGKPLLWYQVERLKRSKLIDNIIIATSTNKSDDALVDFAKTYNLDYFRGSESDVLDRIASCIDTFKIDTHVEFLGDSPLADPELIDHIISTYLENKETVDFVSNDLKVTYPPGLEIKAYRANCLTEQNGELDKNDPLREHVALHIVSKPNRYRLLNIEAPKEHHNPELYLEVDTQSDFEVIQTIIEALYPDNPNFSTVDIINFVNKNPSLIQKSQETERRWKTFKEDV